MRRFAVGGVVVQPGFRAGIKKAALGKPPAQPGEKEGIFYCPVPSRLIICGVVGSSSLTVSVADCCPLAVGVNVMVIVQLLFAGTLLPQVLVSVNSPASVPPN